MILFYLKKKHIFCQDLMFLLIKPPIRFLQSVNSSTFPAIIPKFQILRRSYDLVIIIMVHGRMCIYDLSSSEMREEAIP